MNIFGKGVIQIEHNRLLTLALAYTEGCVTNERLRYALNIHKADIAILLKDLCNKNYLKAEGRGRGTKYHLPMNEGQGSNVDSNLGSNIGSNIGSNVGSNVGSNIGSNVGSNVGSNIGNKPKTRLSRNELRRLIMDACSEWVSLEEIAVTVEKNSDYLISKVFPAMMEEGLIERMYPDTPRHPYQKYKKK